MVVGNMESSREKVRRLLRELFQFDAQDLDFGIYRILNFRRKEIERFIEKDLIEAVEAEFKEYAKAGMVELQRDVERLKAEIIRDFGEGTIDAQGRVMKHEDAPKIKEYLRKVEELKSAEVSEAQMNEVFNHVYEFFSRYYDKGDFISKRRYGGKEKYYVPYNGEEVILHWANKDQYYVKTAEYFRNYHFKAGGYRVNFLLREAEVEVNNVVGENKYFVLCDSDFVKVDEEKRIVDIYFEWRALTDEEERKFGKRNVQDALVVDAIDRIFSETSGSNVGNVLRVKENGEKTVLEKHLNNYVQRNTTDYFIHKNLKAFLERELEFYIKNEVVDLDELENLDERSLRIARAKVKAIREISKKIIEFLAQIEDFQKKLFEKKKFIIGTEYVITLDKINEYAGEEFLQSIVDEVLKNPKQLEEWKQLSGIKVNNKKDLIEKQTVHGKEWKKLPIDTRYYGEAFKLKLIEGISQKKRLSEMLDGILIKSENWQALNLLLNEFAGKIQCIYIDPPFNTGTNEFLYKNDYLDSSWASMMYDRLDSGRQILANDGSIYVRIDYHGNHYVRMMLDSVFGEQNFQNEIIINRRKKSAEETNRYNVSTDSLFLYSKSELYFFNKPVRKRVCAFCGSQKEPEWHIMISSGIRHPPERKIFGKIMLPPRGHHWTYSQERIDQMAKEGRLRVNEKATYVDLEGKKVRGMPEYLQTEFNPVDSSWIDLKGYTANWDFPTENAEELLQRVIVASTNENDWVMDFFLGSGSTTAVAHKLSRKWIGVEMGDFFDSIPLRRMKAVLAGERSGISKEVDWKGGGFFKYHYVEQYEDTLANIAFIEKDKTIQETLDEFGDYLLKNMLEFETRGSPTRLNVEQFQTPFDYKIWVTTAGEKRLATVDLVETFNYLLGITVEKFRTFKNQEREYRCIFGKLNQENIAIIWRNTKDIDLKKDKEFIENTILAGTRPDRIFINGDSLVEKAEPIEPEFKRLMGA
jgi:adenine-specific DNA-methyltransferase